MTKPNCFLAGILAIALSTAAVPALADEPTGTVVASGLNTPWGIATFGNYVYVSESGAGQVVVVNPSTPDKPATPVITGFETRPFNKDLKLGPLGLAFVDKDNFLVGGGDLGPGKDMVRLFTPPAADKPPEKPLTVDDAKAKLGPIAPSDQSKSGEGQFFSVVATSNALYVLGQGDPDQGWVLSAPITAEKKVSELKPFFAAVKSAGLSGPFALTMSKQGALLVGCAGEFGKPADSTITFFHSKSGKKMLHVAVDLNDLVDLGYSPKTGRLYALDFSSSDPSHGGLYRIDDDGINGAKSVKIVSLDRPTSMTFTPDGTLYITLLGTAPKSTSPPGQVVKFIGL